MTRSEAELITRAGEAKAALSRTAPLRNPVPRRRTVPHRAAA